eukprot:TRINITY_DN3444_c0_g1_i6.p1 TRINITY_DN3444_c0_g1~~TRINITY_DN3444_c0_g1_i6.p1  ORF type:complete len:393 (+),score=62.95 TRINITY_DN3444_c0_g1_i6:156-1334(+)
MFQFSDINLFGVVVVVLLSVTAAQLLPQANPVNLIDFASPPNMLLTIPEPSIPQDDIAVPQCQHIFAKSLGFDVTAPNFLEQTLDPCLPESTTVVIPSPEPTVPKFDINNYQVSIAPRPPPPQIQTMEIVESIVQPQQQSIVQNSSPWYRPTPGLSWQYQLQGRVQVDVDADVFILNLFEIDSQIVSEIKLMDITRRKVICYFSAGVYEDWNADALDYPQRILGKPVSGWPGERWIDIRETQEVRPLMAARLDRAKDKNCDGVLLDHLDAYDEDTGFALVQTDQVDHNNWLANAAHERGLSVGIQNAAQIIPQVESNFDFAVSENCDAQNSCLDYRIFIENNKAVFAVEYIQEAFDLITWGQINEYCSGAKAAGLSGILKRLDLMEGRIPCP